MLTLRRFISITNTTLATRMGQHDNTRKKTSQLLHYAGMEVQDIFVDLDDPDPAGDEDPYAVCIRKLDHHFRSDENIPFERRVFQQLAPTDGESVDELLCVSVDKQGIVILVMLSMTTYEIS